MFPPRRSPISHLPSPISIAVANVSHDSREIGTCTRVLTMCRKSGITGVRRIHSGARPATFARFDTESAGGSSLAPEGVYNQGECDGSFDGEVDADVADLTTLKK
jgi:hypothetical protein